MRIIRAFAGSTLAVMILSVAAASTFFFVADPATAAPATAGPAAAQESSGRTAKPALSRKPAPKPAGPAPMVPKAVPVPDSCASLIGVERRICIECDREPIYKRIGCQQRVFWTACKGKRLLADSYCQVHQDQGPPRGEGN